MTRSLALTILGCGTSSGVPRIDGNWGKCNPDNPKNNRRRASVLVTLDDVAVLVDTAPDLRMQILDAQVKRIDAVFFTHDHADHCHGIDDLRGLYQHNRRMIPCYCNQMTYDILTRRFDYVFASKGSYPTIATLDIITKPITIGALTITPFVQIHGPVESLGFHFSTPGINIAYSTDVTDFPFESLPNLRNLDLWVLDALRERPHPTHLHLEASLEWIERMAAKKAILTHMNCDMDYDQMRTRLPKHVVPAYDGLRTEFPCP